MTAIIATRERTRPPFPGWLLWSHLQFALLVWMCFAVFILLVILGFAYWRDVEISGWDRAKEAVRWYSAGVGFHLAWSVLPLLITHGRTRREFAAQALTFIPVFAVALTLMTVATFAAETGLYRLAGWEQQVGAGQLYSSAPELHLVFLQEWLFIVLWGIGGLFIGSAWYRSDWLGSVAVLVGLMVVASISVTFGVSYGQVPGGPVVETASGIAIVILCAVLLLGFTWLVIRDIPVRNKTA